MIIAAFVFWGSLIFLLYIYFLYPLFLLAVAHLLRSRAVKPILPEEAVLPSISVLVIARNEADRIGAKVENLLALDYPADLMELVIASDGSTDETGSEVAEHGGRHVNCIKFRSPRGKPAVLNDVVPNLRGDIVVLMDARQRVGADVIKQLVGHFKAPEVGAVSGELIIETHGAEGSLTVQGMGAYWHLEKLIRKKEAVIDSSIGVTGALYAIRRELYQPIPEDTLLDDVLIPMNVVRQGFRVLFAPQAQAFDSASRLAGDEYRRKVRTIAGNFQLFRDHPWLLNPFSNRLWLQTISHKLARLLGPPALLAIVVSNLLMLGHPLYQLLLVAQLFFYGAALAGHAGFRWKKAAWLTSIPFMFCLLNWTTVAGFIRFVRRSQPVTWQQAH